jgi:hypothetical protein
VNLQHVPEKERPEQAALEVDYDPWAGKSPASRNRSNPLTGDRA